MTVTLYTDASFCNKRKVAACGYIIMVSGEAIKHEIIIVSDCHTINDGEFLAAIKGIQEAYLQKGVTEIEFYTDSMSIIVFKNGIKAQRKPLAKEFSETMEMLKEDGIIINMHHVKAHSDNKFNTKVDKSCRSILRSYIKNNE